MYYQDYPDNQKVEIQKAIIQAVLGKFDARDVGVRAKIENGDNRRPLSSLLEQYFSRSE